MKKTTSPAFRHLFFPILALLFASLVGCASSSHQSSTGEYIDDSAITTKVKADILAEPSLRSLEIGVETYKGVVQLSGFVSSQERINKAVQITKGVPGVRGVKNNLIVK